MKAAVGPLYSPAQRSLKMHHRSENAQVKWTFTGPLVWIGKIAFKGGILSGKTGFFSPGLDLKHATI